jgi:hypothetical protein
MRWLVPLLLCAPAYAQRESDLLAPYPEQPPQQEQAPSQPIDPYAPQPQPPPPRPPYCPPQNCPPQPYYYPPPPYYQVPQPYYGPPVYAQPATAAHQVFRARARRLIKLELAYAYRYAFGDSLNGAALEVMLGSEGTRTAGGGRLGLELGRTYAGLEYQVYQLGGGFEWKIGKRFRLGMSPTLSFIVFQRVTRANTGFWTIALGSNLDFLVDLVKRQNGGALYLGVRLGYDFMLASDNANAFSARLRLGYRF